MTESQYLDGLLPDLKDFLTSSATNVEWMSDSLRAALNVPTGLEDVVREAIHNGQSVAIAGTAGSGKTHLLQTMGGNGDYKIVGDLAALPEREWKALFKSGAKVIVAGNEGAFLQGQNKGYAGFSEIINALHEVQKGTDYRADGPVVIDAAGFDPAGAHTIDRMLLIPLLSEYISKTKDPLARLAWEMIQDATVRKRLAQLVELASAESEADGFTFRQLWQFISDLIVGAERNETWFGRIFSGTSEVSRRLVQAFDPRTIPLPHIGNRLWHGDLEFLKAAYCDSAIPVLEYLLSRKAESVDQKVQQFSDLRLLSMFGMRESPIDSMLRNGASVWSSVRTGDCPPLLHAINRYFAFDLLQLGDDVELWLQHDTERRVFKPNVQISLGTALSGDFELLHSKVVGNRPDQVEQVRGGRRILLHKPSGAVLTVTKDLVDGILKTRSHRIHDRKDVEYDWRLTQFFEQIAKQASRADRLRVAKFDFQARTGRVVIWQIGTAIKKVTA